MVFKHMAYILTDSP